jgi:2-oxoglutarate dehydrogenase complex dehydrogenase (E1) component-like enzyme
MKTFFISYTTLPRSVEIVDPFTKEKAVVDAPVVNVFCEHIEATSIKAARTLAAKKAGSEGEVIDVTETPTVEVNPRHEPEQPTKAGMLAQMQELMAKINALPEDAA